MNFHKKILLSFLVYHLIFSFGVLLVEYLIALSGGYDEYRIDFSLVFVFHIVFMSTVSIGLVVLAYVSRYFWLHIKHRKLS